nr:TatD family hydrolase [Candidatus Enterousia merdequi]
MKIIDAHTHIDYISHKHQDDVFESICCATNESQWIDLVNIIKNDNAVYGAFGIHPWYLDSVKPEFDERLEELLLNNDSYMVGEIGLDKYKPYLDKQINVFEKQLKVAVKLHRAVVLHCVGAWDKVLNI